MGDIKIYVKEIGCEDVDWMILAQDINRCRALMNTVMNPQIPLKAGIYPA